MLFWGREGSVNCKKLEMGERDSSGDVKVTKNCFWYHENNLKSNKLIDHNGGIRGGGGGLILTNIWTRALVTV